MVAHTHRPLIAYLGERAVHYDEDPRREHVTYRGKVVLNPDAVTNTHRWLKLDLDAHFAAWHAV